MRNSARTHGKNIGLIQMASTSFFLQFGFIGDTSTEGGGKYTFRPNCLLFHQEINARIGALVLSLKGAQLTGLLAKLDMSTISDLSHDLLNHWDENYPAYVFKPCKVFKPKD